MDYWLVKHSIRGAGRVLVADNSQLLVRFSSSGSICILPLTSFSDGLARQILEPGTRCMTSSGDCEVMEGEPGSGNGLTTYRVRLESGEQSLVPESHLTPLFDAGAVDPVGLLGARQLDSYKVFRAREDFRAAHVQNVRPFGYHRALLSSRIDLHPHQISVALTVLSDVRRRYILADEVGLGKTIEAGIVLHELLLANPAARVLVVCPGTLAQQWFAELYSKFCGRIFTMLDLRKDEDIRWGELKTVIVSTTRVAAGLGAKLGELGWDLVVFDEAHYLLGTQYLYDFALNLSKKTRSLLLLSALPAQRREDEFLQLLRLLEPERFAEDTDETRRNFRELFKIQGDVGRILKLLQLRLENARSGNGTSTQLKDYLNWIAGHELFLGDTGIQKACAVLAADPGKVLECGEAVRRGIADRHRINRRILRNRRQILVENGEFVPIQRQYCPEPFQAGPRELEAVASAERLLRDFWERSLGYPLKVAFAQTLLESLSSPDLASSFFESLAVAVPATITPKGEDYLSLGHVTGYEDWKRYQTLIKRSVRGDLDESLLVEYREALLRWNRSDSERESRIASLCKVLGRLRRQGARKILTFAGYPGLARELWESLSDEGGTVLFTYGMTREDKEVSARDFERKPGIWLMIVDESGGEGRNFQFADALVHYDHPWHVSRVEQRIGRLDRIGRTREQGDVASHVIFRAGTSEEGLTACYADGLGVYQRSISGLEFGLRDAEQRIAETAVLEGRDGMLQLVPSLRERAEEERARDEAEAVFDAASFDRARAKAGHNALAQEKNEAELERSMTAYLQMIAGTHSAKPLEIAGYPVGFWRLRLENARPGMLPSASTTEQFVGTFKRRLAQDRFDHGFFQVGHPVYDELTASLECSAAGRVYALQGKVANAPPWVGFEFSFFILPNATGIASRPELEARARASLINHPVRIYVRRDGVTEEDGEFIRKIRRLFTAANKDQVWRNLNGAKAAALALVFPDGDWAASVRRLEGVAAAQARNKVEAQIGESLRREAAQMRRKAQEYRLQNSPDAESAATDFDALASAIEGWGIATDSAGFLAINVDMLSAS
jgi:ATP-dependent helicase HepA